MWVLLFDFQLTPQDIENETLGNTQQAYQAAMEQQRKEMRARKLDSLAQARADTLVDGWGVWLQCRCFILVGNLTTVTDDTMSEFFMGVAKAPVFKWKLDVDAHKTGKGAEPPAPAPAAVAVQEEPVWQQDHQMLQNVSIFLDTR
jgi:hypothetical protein